jgi:hypothetical protein
MLKRRGDKDETESARRADKLPADHDAGVAVWRRRSDAVAAREDDTSGASALNYSLGSALLGGPSPCRDFGSYAATSHQRFGSECSDCPNRAHHGKAESREQH